MLENVKIYQIQACVHKQFNHLLACLHVAREVQIHNMHILVFFSLLFFNDYESHAVLAVKLNFYFFVHWAQNYNASLTLKVDLNLRFSLKSTKVHYNRFSYFKVDLKLRKYLNI